jgi:beta-lactamase regulating signal transducer with metallopeptidase domain
MIMSPDLIHAGSTALTLMLDAALRSLILACFLAVVLELFRVRVVRAELFAWRGLLFVALAMPLLMWLSPAVPLAVPVPSFSRDAAATSVQAAQPAPAIEVAPMRALHRERTGDEHEAMVSGAPAVLSEPPAPAMAAGRAISWPFLALAGYAAITLFFFVRLLIGAYFGLRLKRASTPVGDAATLQALAAACCAAKVRQSPRLAESAAIRVPVTLGACRPAILLPAGWREWRNDELAAVLAHELSHVARCDALLQQVVLLHRAIFWFSPLSWWLDRHLANLAEQASDEAALAAGADRTRYAETLLSFLARLQTSPARVRWHGMAMAKTGQGEARVERILSWRPPMCGKLSKWLIVALVAVCAPAVALTASLHPSPYARQDAAIPAPVAAPLSPAQLAPPDSGAVALMAVPAAPASPQPGEPPEIAPPSAAPMLPNKAIAPPAAVPPPPQAPAQTVAPARPQEASPAVPPVAVPAVPAMPAAGDWGAWDTYANQFGPYWFWGPHFAIVTKGSGHLIVNGSAEDAEHARALRSKIHGDFIWFEHDGKSYIIRNQAIVDRAKKIWAPRGDAAKLHQELQAKQQELSKEMREQVQQKMQEIRVKVPDMTAELQELQSELKNLNTSGATLQQLGDLQREVGQLQQSLAQARWNSNMQEINRRAGELGREMGDLGRQIGEMARQEVQRWSDSSEQMRQLFENAIASGAAKPE